jgi:hypothetical protein
VVVEEGDTKLRAVAMITVQAQERGSEALVAVEATAIAMGIAGLPAQVTVPEALAMAAEW